MRATNPKTVLKAAQKLMEEKDHMEVTGRGLEAMLPQMSTKQKRKIFKDLISYGMSEEEALQRLKLKKEKID